MPPPDHVTDPEEVFVSDVWLAKWIPSSALPLWLSSRFPGLTRPLEPYSRARAAYESSDHDLDGFASEPKFPCRVPRVD
jgi:hypothetical protein